MWKRIATFCFALLLVAGSFATSAQASIFPFFACRSMLQTPPASQPVRVRESIRVIRHGYYPEIYRDESGYGEG